MEEIFIKYRKTSGVYMIQSKINPELTYIGSSENITKRWNGHLCTLRYGKHSRKIQSHYDKYGVDDLQFIVLVECTKDELRDVEHSYLTKYKPVWNIRHFAQRNKSKVTWSKETRESVTEARRKNPKPPHRLMGKKIDESWRINISKGHIGIKHTMEERIKIGNSNKGKNIGAKGYRAKKVIQYDLDGNYIATYGAIREASRVIGLCPTFIRQCLIGKKKSAKFIFKYDTE